MAPWKPSGIWWLLFQSMHIDGGMGSCALAVQAAPGSPCSQVTPFQLLPSPDLSSAVPMQHQWSHRLKIGCLWQRMEVLRGGRAVVCPLPQLLPRYSCPLVLGWPVTRAEGWCPGGMGQRSPAHSSLFPCRWGWGLTRVCQGLYVTLHPNGSPCRGSCGPHRGHQPVLPLSPAHLDQKSP